MSQQYGPPQGGWGQQAPGGQGQSQPGQHQSGQYQPGQQPGQGQPGMPPGGGWGQAPAGAGGTWGPGPGRPVQPGRPKSGKTQWIVLGCAALAVALVAVGVVLLVNGGGKKETADGGSPNPVGTLYTPPTPTETVITKGPNDKGVEVGHGVWFTPQRGWLRSPDKTVSGQYWILQQARPKGAIRGLIDGYFWVRQTQLYDAKGFAEKLVDVESKGFKDVRIDKGQQLECANQNLKVCYTISYTAKVPTKRAGLLPFRGYVTAYQDGSGWTTATDVGLEEKAYPIRLNQLKAMNKSVEDSFAS